MLILPSKTYGVDFNPETDITWHSFFWAEGTDFLAQGYTDTDNVTTWPNETGEADLTDATGPVYVAADTSMNSQPTVDFATDALNSVGFTTDADMDLTIVVAAYADNATGIKCLFDGNDLTTGRVRIQIQGANNWELKANTTRHDAVTASTGLVFARAYLDGTATANGDFLYINESQVVNDDAGVNTVLDSITLGANLTSGNDWDGPIALVGVYEGDLTADGQWANFKTWLNSHYGYSL